MNCRNSERKATTTLQSTPSTEPNEALLPVMEPSGEVDVHDPITLKQLIQECEHSGCSSGRARAILVIAESCSTDTITRPPRMLANRAQPHEPQIPGPLRTLFPPQPPVVDGFLSIAQDYEITNEMQNLLVDVANKFQAALHSNSFEAAKTFLEQIIQSTNIDNLPDTKRRRLG